MTVPTLSPRLEALREKIRHSRGRLIFALDATGSREPTWDMAAQLQAEMFTEAAHVGGLDVQLLYYRGHDEVRHSAWISDAPELIRQMSGIRCAYGGTKIARMLRHIKTQHDRARVNAAIFIGDAVEEQPKELYDAAAGLDVPLFVFQEGDGVVIYHGQHGEPAGGQPVEDVFRELARLTGGAYGRFNAGAARQLGELLRAVAAFAAGGMTALANQNTDSARKLLGQMK
jgi:hypothetical protein